MGIGEHAHSVVDSIEQAEKYNIIGFLDTEQMQGKHFRDYQVIGTDGELPRYFEKGIKNVFCTVGFMGHRNIRNKLYSQLKDIGFRLPSIIDRTASVSQNEELEEGIFIGKNQWLILMLK